MAFSTKTALGYLKHAYEQGRLAHAYLISGPAGAGKRQLAAELAELVNGTDRADVFSTRARDIFVAEPESKSRRILTEQVRGLEHALQMRAAAGRRKVAIVSEADRLQSQAANAFLKTLEEPPKDSLLLLLSEIPEVLPDTILSRCVTIPLEVNGSVRVEEKALLELLRKAGAEPKWDIACAYRLAQEFEGLLRALRDEIRSKTDEALKKEEARYRNATDGRWLEEREDYYKALTESLYLRRRTNFIETLLVWWADILRAATGIERRDLTNMETAAVAKRFTATEILHRIRVLEELRENLDRNIQEALAIEVAFLSIFAAAKL